MLGKNENLRGCLLGLAIGDAMGYPVDKKTLGEIFENYGPNGLLGFDLTNGSAEVSSYTQLAAFVCNGILLADTRRNNALYNRFVTLSIGEWAKNQHSRLGLERAGCWVAHVPAMRRRNCMDTRMLDALSRSTLGTPEAPVFISDTPGALTVAAAVGLCYDPDKISLHTIGRIAMEATALTHGDPMTLVAGAYLACCIAMILQDPGKSLAEHFNRCCETITDQLSLRYPQQVSRLCDQISQVLTLTRDPMTAPRDAMEKLECRTALQCLVAAIYTATVHCGNFDEAMITAVNHSGRSSAVAAVTGAILGARLGAQELPDFYLESLEPMDTLQELTDDLTEGRQLSRIFDDSWDQKYVQGKPAN